MNHQNRKGFTLIELLIVVAIIAILAAIAIPNFLAAQTRAKIAKVQADMASIAVGIEAYYVDNNVYVPADGTTWTPPGGNQSRQILRLSTPISYMSDVPLDRFNSQWLDNNYPGSSGLGRPFAFYSNTMAPLLPGQLPTDSLGQGLSYPPDAAGGYFPGQVGSTDWVLISYGPSQYPYWAYPAGPNWPYVAYDPTNGTVSWGGIFRVGP